MCAPSCACCPTRWFGSWARLLGLAFYALDRVHRRVAETNLATAFPKRSAADRQVITRAMFVHFGRLLLELLKFSTLDAAGMRARIEFEGRERAESAYAQGKGVLFVTGHFGFWEIHAIGHGLELQPIGVLARALDNPYLNTLLEQVRGRSGNFVIYRHGAVRKVLRALAAGQGVAMLIDQHMHSPDAIYVDFFERPGSHHVDAGGAGAAHRRAGGAGLRAAAARRPLSADLRARRSPPPDQDSPDAVREFTQRCTDVLEMYVRRHPSQWLWMHRRWRDAPLPAETPGMFPSAKATSR